MSQACGCRVEWQYEKGQTLSKDYVIYYCPLHQAAPAMREALRLVVGPNPDLENTIMRCQEALAQAEGRI